MADKKSKIFTIAARPIDCTKFMLKTFYAMVMAGGEVLPGNLQHGIPTAERLFFTGEGETIMGVGAIRHSQTAYHKNLFDQAGVPEMFNPDSIEICWLYVDPKYRDLGIWKNARDFRLDFMGSRPSHGIHRVENDLISPRVDKKTDYVQAGKPFDSPNADHKIKLIVRNHDPVYDPSKKFYYGRESL
jgi:hypothetical protein